MDTSTIDLLRKARALIEQGWCQDCGAKDAAGHPVRSIDADAVSFCAIGAVESAAAVSGRISSDNPALVALWIALPEGFTSVSGFNDDRFRTREEVLGLYDQAIAWADAEQAA